MPADRPRRPGVCPRVDIVTTCEVRKDACRSDSECTRGQKCCSYGCGRKCLPVCKKSCRRGQICRMAHVKCLNPPCNFSSCIPIRKPVTRPGTCPSNNIIGFCAITKDSCTSDAACKRGQKCCSYGCGKKCVPVCKKSCRRGQICRMAHVKCLNPPCNFSSCIPIRKPVSRPGTCPSNNRIGLCVITKDSCTSDAACKRGQKCCSYGCGKKCVPVCKKSCRRGQICRMAHVKCLNPPCNFSSCIPIRKPVSRPGTCPSNNGIGPCVITKNSCTSDAKCRRGQKCCSYGCGKECLPVCSKPCPPGQKCKLMNVKCLYPPCNFSKCVPDKPVVRPGYCPPNYVSGYCAITKNSCSSDANCGLGQKCCRRGCGRECVTIQYLKG